MRRLYVNREELAYVAGLIEGEGSIGWKNNRGPRVAIEMTDEDVILRLAFITGLGRTYATHRHTKPGKTHWKPSWVWAVQNQQDAYALMVAIWPWMSLRRKQEITTTINRWL